MFETTPLLPNKIYCIHLSFLPPDTETTISTLSKTWTGSISRGHGVWPIFPARMQAVGGGKGCSVCSFSFRTPQLQRARYWPGRVDADHLSSYFFLTACILCSVAGRDGNWACGKPLHLECLTGLKEAVTSGPRDPCQFLALLHVCTLQPGQASLCGPRVQEKAP